MARDNPFAFQKKDYNICMEAERSQSSEQDTNLYKQLAFRAAKVSAGGVKRMVQEEREVYIGVHNNQKITTEQLRTLLDLLYK